MCYYSGVYLWYQALDDIKKEYEVTKQIHDLLNGFKANPVKEARKYKMEDKPSQPAPTRDPDVWPPPTPVESRFVSTKGKPLTDHPSHVFLGWLCAICMCTYMSHSSHTCPGVSMKAVLLAVQNTSLSTLCRTLEYHQYYLLPMQTASQYCFPPTQPASQYCLPPTQPASQYCLPPTQPASRYCLPPTQPASQYYSGISCSTCWYLHVSVLFHVLLPCSQSSPT